MSLSTLTLILFIFGAHVDATFDTPLNRWYKYACSAENIKVKVQSPKRKKNHENVIHKLSSNPTPTTATVEGRSIACQGTRTSRSCAPSLSARSTARNASTETARSRLLATVKLDGNLGIWRINICLLTFWIWPPGPGSFARSVSPCPDVRTDTAIAASSASAIWAGAGCSVTDVSQISLCKRSQD